VLAGAVANTRFVCQDILVYRIRKHYLKDMGTLSMLTIYTASTQHIALRVRHFLEASQSPMRAKKEKMIKRRFFVPNDFMGTSVTH
jgi:hypothetical protein